MSFGVGFLVLFGNALVQGHGPAFARLTQVPVWMLLGGFLGAWYVFASSGRRVTGRCDAGRRADPGPDDRSIGATGAPGMAVREITATRLAAAGLVAAVLLLSRF